MTKTQANNDKYLEKKVGERQTERDEHTENTFLWLESRLLGKKHNFQFCKVKNSSACYKNMKNIISSCKTIEFNYQLLFVLLIFNLLSNIFYIFRK